MLGLLVYHHELLIWMEPPLVSRAHDRPQVHPGLLRELGECLVLLLPCWDLLPCRGKGLKKEAQEVSRHFWDYRCLGFLQI
jgi:hypothetical protein